MSLQRHLLFWILAFAVLLGFVFIFKSVLLPFVLGIAVAYLLNPIVEKLSLLKIGKWAIGRSASALLILLSFFLVVLLGFGAILPILYREAQGFSLDAPDYLEKLLAFIQPFSLQMQGLLGIENGADLKTMAAEYAGTALSAGQQVAGTLAAGGEAVVGFITVLVIMPIVAYFMMKEWPHILKWFSDFLPRHSEETIKTLLSEINVKISGFVRGQIMVALFLGVVYAIALSLVGLKYGFLIGLAAGLLSIIPMVGSSVGLLVAVIVAWFQAGELSFVLIVGGIFIAGQIIEGNILTPKLIGDRVGLHPLWIFFALMAGGSLFGVLGMLLAVPVAAIFSVLIAFALRQYKASPYYEVKGKSKGKSKAKAVTSKTSGSSKKVVK